MLERDNYIILIHTARKVTKLRQSILSQTLFFFSSTKTTPLKFQTVDFLGGQRIVVI